LPINSAEPVAGENPDAAGAAAVQSSLPKTSSAQRVSVVLENVSLAEALKKVSAASGYEFFYNSNVVLKSDKRITASFDGTELKTVLDHVFSGTEFSYRIKDRTIVVVPRPAQPAPEEPAFVEIAGRITDGSNKAPMAGVSSSSRDRPSELPRTPTDATC